MKDKEIIKNALRLDFLQGFKFVQWVVWIPESDEFLAVYDSDRYASRKGWAQQPGYALDFGSSSRAVKVSGDCSRGAAALLFESSSQYMAVELEGVMKEISDYAPA